jgi:hypothetical protein
MKIPKILKRADRPKARSRMKRNSSPIRAYVGLNGAGKTLTAVYDTIPYLEAGMKVLSSVRFLDYNNRRLCDDETCVAENHDTHYAAHPNWIPLREFSQILHARNTVIFLDEIQGIMSSRDYSTLPTPILNAIMQQRRNNNVIIYTTPFFGRADKALREVTHTVTLCSPYLSKTKKSEPGQPPILWKIRYAILARTYAAELMDEFDARGADLGNMRPKVFQFYIRPFNKAQNAYDSYDSVLSIGASDSLGSCMTCGGKRSQSRCSCPVLIKEHADKTQPGGSAAVVSPVTLKGGDLPL